VSSSFPLVCVLSLLLLGVLGAQGAEPPQTRTPAEWLDIVVRETKQEEAGESPQRRSLLLGAAMALHPYDGRPQMLAKLSGAHKARYEPFRRWMAEHGESLFRTWRSGTPLAPDDLPFRFLLHGVALTRYRYTVLPKERQKTELTAEERDLAAYIQGVGDRGRAVLRKGYLGGSLTRAELDALRLYAMRVDNQCCNGKLLPFHLGLCGPGGRSPGKLGDPAPDFTLLRAEAPLASPHYSDRNPYDPTDVLRPAILREYLLLMQGYEPHPKTPGRAVAKPIAVPEGREADYVTLSSFRGRKPVLFVLANPTDSWCWHWKMAPVLQPLQDACGDRIAFFFINTTIHDTYMPARDYFEPAAARHSAVHDLSLEERARTSKMFHMHWPQCTTPYLLDDMAQRTRNAWRDQGGGAYVVLVDLDGRLAYVDYHRDIPPHWGPKAVGFPYEFVTIRMNHLESRLARFAAGGFRYAPAIETPFPAWRRDPELEGTVAAVDPAAGSLAVKLPKGAQRRFAVAPTTRVTLDGAPARLPDLKPGDRARVLWPKAQRNAEAPTARGIEAGRGTLDPARRHTVWMGGLITAVDAQSRILTVVRHKLQPETLRGWNFWQQAGDRATPHDPSTKTRLGTLARWLRETDRTRRFLVDAAVDLFVDGRAAALSDLKPGRPVGILYPAWQDAAERILPIQIRAYSLGGE